LPCCGVVKHTHSDEQWIFTEPEQGVFNFTEGDIVTSIAQKNHLIQRCHALVWHSQLAPWVEATNWTADALSSVIVNHITNVMGHYKGKCYAWDVVNEALNEDGTYRESIFYTTLGEEYIKLAFSTASKADPGAKLYYNDYNLESPGNKSEGAVRIVKLLKDHGIRIDGVGMQAHFVASGAPSLDEQIAVIESYAAHGVEVAYTELDVRIELPLNDTNLEWQKQAYTEVSVLCPSRKVSPD
jgi:endo-1,4-beta-xylanase